jgi:hypothetical protein
MVLHRPVELAALIGTQLRHPAIDMDVVCVHPYSGCRACHSQLTDRSPELPLRQRAVMSSQWQETEAVKRQALSVRRVIKAPPHIWPKRHNPQLTFGPPHSSL